MNTITGKYISSKIDKFMANKMAMHVSFKCPLIVKLKSTLRKNISVLFRSMPRKCDHIS